MWMNIFFSYLFESHTPDWSKWLANWNFVQSNGPLNRTLSIVQPLFWALYWSPKMKYLEMFEQIISSSNIRNIWRTVWRTWILILDLKGLKLIYPWISTYLSLSRLCNLRYFRRFFIDYASRYNVRKKVKSHHCVISEVLSKDVVIRTTPLCNKICSTCCAFSRPKLTCVAASDINSMYGVTHIILSSQKSVFIQLAKTWFVARQVWMWVSKCTT